MLYYVDSEFVDDGRTIDLISIGLVCEDGRELYMQSSGFNPIKASQWVKGNVIARLAVCPHSSTQGQLSRYDSSIRDMPEIHSQIISLTRHEIHGQCTFEQPDKGIIGAYTDCPWRTPTQIRNEVIAFCDPEKYGKPKFVAWCGGFDFVVFCQLFGTMMDLPSSFPHYFKDLQNALDERGIPDHDLPVQEGATHNALSDARYIKLVWEAIVNPLYRSPTSRME